MFLISSERKKNPRLVLVSFHTILFSAGVFRTQAFISCRFISHLLCSSLCSPERTFRWWDREYSATCWLCSHSHWNPAIILYLMQTTEHHCHSQHRILYLFIQILFYIRTGYIEVLEVLYFTKNPPRTLLECVCESYGVYGIYIYISLNQQLFETYIAYHFLGSQH